MLNPPFCRVEMSTKGSSHSNNTNMGSTPFFHEFKKQASFFLKEKIKTARLALTDVTPAQLLTEEATNGNPWAPDTRTLGLISRAAFEVDDYWRIVDILHQRLSRFDRNNWRPSYKALIVLEHLLTHGPESVAKEFECEEQVIKEMQSFQHIDEKGFNWGLAVRKKAERILKLLEKGPLLKEERHRARSLAREIQGFGSFNERTSTSSDEGILREYERSHSQFNEHGNQEDNLLMQGDDHRDAGKQIIEIPQLDPPEKVENSRTRSTLKENTAPAIDATITRGDLHTWNGIEEGESLMNGKKGANTGALMDEDHPFYNDKKQSTLSLLAARQDD
ncbi:hypothetical protein Ancab_011642 [Ancistrocladus abbreviatus]